MDYDRPTVPRKGSNKMGVVLFAAVAGAVAGMMFAPKKGTEMRADAKEKYNSLKNKSQDTAQTAKSKLDKGVEATRSKVHDVADKTKDVADKASDKTKIAADQAKISADEAAFRARTARTDVPR